MGQLCLLVVLITTVCAIGAKVKERHSPIQGAEVNKATYNVKLTKYKTRLMKRCIVLISVSGHGIGAQYNVPCSVYGVNVIATDRVLVVHNRDSGNPLALYSDTNSVLVGVYQDTCVKHTFVTRDGKTTSTREDMTIKSCEKVLRKIDVEEKLATNPLKETKRKIKLVFRRMFPPEFFEALKTVKPDEDVYSPGWNSWGEGPR